MTNYDMDELERQGLIPDYPKYDFVDLETEIQNVWQTKDDLDSITERIYDDPDGPMTEDQIGNVLCGLSELHETRCKKLWKVFEAILSQRRNTPHDAVSPFPTNAENIARGAAQTNNEITRDYRGVQLDNEGERFRTEGNDPNKWDSGNSAKLKTWQSNVNKEFHKKLEEEHSIKKVPKYYREGLNPNDFEKD
jgi:hypothetical protein